MKKEPTKTFHEVLHSRDKGLYYKWLHNGALTSYEKEELAICARLARNLAK